MGGGQYISCGLFGGGGGTIYFMWGLGEGGFPLLPSKQLASAWVVSVIKMTTLHIALPGREGLMIRAYTRKLHARTVNCHGLQVESARMGSGQSYSYETAAFNSWWLTQAVILSPKPSVVW